MIEQPNRFSDIYQTKMRPPLRLMKSPQPLPPEPKSNKRRNILLCIGFLIVVALLFYGIRALLVKKMASESATLIKQRIEEAKRALIAFDITAAESAFLDIKRIVADVRSEASRFGLLTLAEVAGTFNATVAAAPDALSIIDRLSDKVLSIIRISENLKSNAFDWISNGQGKLLIAGLTELKSEVSALGAILEEMKATAEQLEYPVGDDVLAFRAELYKSERLLDAAIRWLSDTNHLAILFVNPSEMRPGGGFPGSYAAVTIARGNLGNIDVRDIYDPDGQLDLSVVPPRQLQLVTGSWGARDANWFFDFPTSARKTIYFLNNSKIYLDQDLEFAGALAVNVNVIGSILEVIGPVTLPEYQMTLTEENYLAELQREVRSGGDRTISEPKRVLKVLTPALIKRLGALTASQKHELIGKIREHFAAKDMMAYLKDPVMQAYLEQLSIAGNVDRAERGSLGEYLAVVNANIGGGKTDAVMNQSVDLRSRIDLEGRIHNTLTVKRTHLGKISSAAWYNAVNKNFMQIFTPRGSDAVAVKGNDAPLDIPRSNFSSFSTDPDLAAIERSTEHLSKLGIDQTLAFNKTVFSTWFNIAPGASKTLELQYINPQRVSPRAFSDYVLVFEKQSGVESAFSFSIDAPPEYKWKESNSPNYSYTTKSVPGKLVLKLTLVPMR